MSGSGIYGLTDEDTGEVRYVGRSFDIHTRYETHIKEGHWEARSALGRGWLHSPILGTKVNWLAYMELEAKPVGLTLLEEVEPDLRKQDDREHRWAETLTAIGTPLANGTTGGTRLGRTSKGACPYTPTLPTCWAREIEPPDGLLCVPPRAIVVPILEMPMLRSLREDRPDLHAEVLAGALSVLAAAVSAGIRKPRISVRLDNPASAARSLRDNSSPEFWNELTRIVIQENANP